MNESLSGVAGIFIAALGGLAVGVERQWSGHASGPSAHFGGLRTFTLLGMLAGVAGWLWRLNVPLAAAILLAGAAALVVSAYVAVSRHDIDGTTEVAALIVLAAGTLAGFGMWRLASAIIAATALLLVEKSRLHDLVSRLSEPGLRAGFRFAVMAAVILPVLPQGPYGPLGGIRPRELWLLTLFFSGLSFFGYIARCLAGPGIGYVLTGLLGGIVSSTNVAFTFSRLSRIEPGAGVPLGLGVISASTVLYVRVLAACAVLNAAFAWRLVPYLLPPFLAGVAISLFALRRRSGEPASPMRLPENPLQVGAALQMTAIFQIVLFGVHFMRTQYGEAGIVVSGAVLGLADMDALTVSMAKSAAASPEQAAAAALATAVGALANTVVKLSIAAGLGTGAFRKLGVAGLGALGVISLAAIAAWGDV